jgi:hypothetical protein
MSCEHLVCANCGGLVVEARCPVCRDSRERVHHHTSPLVSSSVALLIALLALIALIALHVH